MQDLEIEVKFYLHDLESMRQRIIDLNAQCHGRFFETNLRFEDSRNSLINNNALLRLRKDKKTTLTYKSSPPEDDKEFKIFNELEVQVGEFKTMKQILAALGFHVAQKYEKWRETFSLGDTHFCLDTMPFGDILEIEGPKKEIRHFSDLLGLNWNERILLNYLEIFDILKDRLNLPFSDLTFDNFRAVDLDAAQFCPHLQAGPTE
ncbi:MAG: class IV adenylate cyclase [Deltaproteobacteria bacterium]|jgi:adenylate cyclase class 2|nr:class IV adenylate cyclase [Deltaproteobacteria bacterium]